MFLSVTDQVQYGPKGTKRVEGEIATLLTNGIELPNRELGIQNLEQLRKLAVRLGVKSYKYTLTPNEDGES